MSEEEEIHVNIVVKTLKQMKHLKRIHKQKFKIRKETQRNHPIN